MSVGSGLPDDGRPGAKFADPKVTATGEARAVAPFVRLETLWVNTGTLCNIACGHCYIESDPRNDRLAYFAADDLRLFLDEAKRSGAFEVGFTGGEPFLNPDMIEMARMSLERGFSVLVLTNAMRPMMRPHVREGLSALHRDFGARLGLRVSLDSFEPAAHDAERGEGAFREALSGLKWLAAEGFAVAVAGRRAMTSGEDAARAGFAALFDREGLAIDAADPTALVLFPEMDEARDTPEITAACWGILNKSPASVMCATSRMVARRKGAERPVVLACTLIAYDARFEMGGTLQEAARPVSLNHAHCSRFCVLGGASCAPRA